MCVYIYIYIYISHWRETAPEEQALPDSRWVADIWTADEASL